MTGRMVPPLDRSRVPESGSVRSFDFPPVLSSSLPNGLVLKMARMTRVPLVTVTVVLDAGEALLSGCLGGTRRPLRGGPGRWIPEAQRSRTGGGSGGNRDGALGPNGLGFHHGLPHLPRRTDGRGRRPPG